MNCYPSFGWLVSKRKPCWRTLVNLAPTSKVPIALVVGWVCWKPLLVHISSTQGLFTSIYHQYLQPSLSLLLSYLFLAILTMHWNNDSAWVSRFESLLLCADWTRQVKGQVTAQTTWMEICFFWTCLEAFEFADMFFLCRQVFSLHDKWCHTSTSLLAPPDPLQ